LILEQLNAKYGQLDEAVKQGREFLTKCPGDDTQSVSFLKIHNPLRLCSFQHHMLAVLALRAIFLLTERLGVVVCSVLVNINQLV